MNAKNPDAFAGQILMAELEIEQHKDDPCIEEIQELLALYAKAIEHYQRNGTDLYLDLNIRMQQFLLKPHILRVLDAEASTTAIRRRKAADLLREEAE